MDWARLTDLNYADDLLLFGSDKEDSFFILLLKPAWAIWGSWLNKHWSRERIILHTDSWIVWHFANVIRKKYYLIDFEGLPNSDIYLDLEHAFRGLEARSVQLFVFKVKGHCGNFFFRLFVKRGGCFQLRSHSCCALRVENYRRV